jgi:hypothetical protein
VFESMDAIPRACADSTRPTYIPTDGNKIMTRFVSDGSDDPLHSRVKHEDHSGCRPVRWQDSSHRASILGIRNDPPMHAAVLRLPTRVHPRVRHLARGLPSIPAEPSQTLRSFKRVVATALTIRSWRERSPSGSVTRGLP